MNKPMTVWGLIIFFGFALTHFLITLSADIIYFWIIWLILLIAGIIIGFSTRKTVKKDKFSLVWLTSVFVGALLTFSIVSSIIFLPGYYIMGIWLLLMGASLLGVGLTLNGPTEISIGLIWLCFAFLIITTPLQAYHFLVSAIVFGIPMTLMGIYSKQTSVH